MTITKDKDRSIMINKSKSYLLPLLNEYIQIEYIYAIENTFINVDNYRNCFSILYNKSLIKGMDEKKWNTYIENLRNHYLFIKDINIKNHILFVFEFPGQYLMDYNNFKYGKYSKFSNESKKIIITFTSNNYQYPELIQDMVHILYKNKIRKEKIESELGVKLDEDAELTSIISEEEETFNFKEYDIE